VFSISNEIEEELFDEFLEFSGFKGDGTIIKRDDFDEFLLGMIETTFRR
jgi:hypothetical protein